MMRRGSIRNKQITGKRINSNHRRIFKLLNLLYPNRYYITSNMPVRVKKCGLIPKPKPERTVRPEVREAYIKNFEDRKDLFKKLAKY